MYIYICGEREREWEPSIKLCSASGRLLMSHQRFSAWFTLSDLILEHTRTVNWFWSFGWFRLFPLQLEVVPFQYFSMSSCAFPCSFQVLRCDSVSCGASMYLPAEASRTRHETLWPWPPCSFLATSCDTWQLLAMIKRGYITIYNNTYIHTCAYMCIHTYMCIHVHTCAYMCIHVHTCAYIHPSIHTYINT